AILLDQPELLAHPGARRAGEANEILRLAGDEEHRVADAEPEFLPHRLGALDAEIARHRAGAALLALAPEDVAEAWHALALRPRVHAVAERAISPGRCRDRPHRGGGIVEDVGKDLEAGAAKALAHVRHPDRVAQVGLVAAVHAQRIGIRDERELRRDRLAVGK